MYVSPGHVGFVHHMHLFSGVMWSAVCSVFFKRGIFDFPFVCNLNERLANVYLIVNG